MMPTIVGIVVVRRSNNPELASKYDALLYPFFLDGVAGQPGLRLEDGLHPNAKGVDQMVERILPTVEKAIAATPGGS